MRETACDMRGFLSFLILWIVKNRAMSGAQISKELEARKGCKPNPGTIYPALKELTRRKVLVIHVEGKEKTYALTPDGRHELKIATQVFCKTFYDVFTK